jgi:A/G-specific adenine glycosylase
MLQQTQVVRVRAYWERWTTAFPTVDALAAASTTDVLELWQGLGYHRRALALKQTAATCADRYGGQVPRCYTDLLGLPGIGPATAAGVCVFAYGQPQVYLETNVRTVLLHHFFEGRDRVPDRELVPLVEATCDAADPRGWYYALLDYGSHLKGILPNPSRRSRHHVRQSNFEGSVRQKRAELLRLVLACPGRGTDGIAASLNDLERTAGRPATGIDEVASLLKALAREGFLARTPPCDAPPAEAEATWHLAD